MNSPVPVAVTFSSSQDTVQVLPLKVRMRLQDIEAPEVLKETGKMDCDMFLVVMRHTSSFWFTGFSFRRSRSVLTNDMSLRTTVVVLPFSVTLSTPRRMYLACHGFMYFTK